MVRGSRSGALLRRIGRSGAYAIRERATATALQLPHPFPAPMSRRLARVIIAELTEPGSLVVDPMVGSGTVLWACRAEGRRGIGFDVDPLALMMAGAACATHDPGAVAAAAAGVTAAARKLAQSPGRLDRYYQRSFDADTKRFIDYWFPLSTRRELLALAEAIRQLVAAPEVASSLRLGFSRTIIAKTSGASLAVDLPHTRPHRSPGKQVASPIDSFGPQVRRLSRSLEALGNEGRGARLRALRGDARDLPLRSGSADLVLTSSPYANGIDYIRAHKFSLVWLGHSIPELVETRAAMIGAERAGRGEPALPGWLRPYLPGAERCGDRRRRVLCKFLNDLSAAVAEAYRVLRPGGACVLVLGRTRVGRAVLDTPEVAAVIGRQAGFEHVATWARSVNPMRRSLPFLQGHSRLGRRLSREAVVALAK